MIIIETCPKCGHDLMDLILAINPPIPKKECPNCGWSWTGNPEPVKRVPFTRNSLILDDLVDLDVDLVSVDELNNYTSYTTLGNEDTGIQTDMVHMHIDSLTI